MIWANPWAWLGLAALAVPVAIHLLSRLPSQAVPFPTIRFLPVSRALDLRRKRLEDPWLLALRCLMLTAAVAALAQPHLPGGTSSEMARAFVIDSSPSARAAARAAAPLDAADAANMLVLERDHLAGAIGEAHGWLTERGGEVVIVSDFQRHAFDPAFLRAIDPQIGVRLIQVERAALPAPAFPRALPVQIEGVSAETAAAIVAAAAETMPAVAGELRGAIVITRSAPARQDLLARSSPPAEPWLAALAATQRGGDLHAVRVIDGKAAIFLETDDVARVAEAVRAAGTALATIAIDELDSRVFEARELRALERTPQERSGPAAGRWAGHWFWVASLALLLVETLWRRRRTPEIVEERAHAA